VGATASMTAAMQSFCTDFKAAVASWPKVDASTAAALAKTLQASANDPDAASVKAALTTIGLWVAKQVTAGAAASTPPDVLTAFDQLKGFAASRC